MCRPIRASAVQIVTPCLRNAENQNCNVLSACGRVFLCQAALVKKRPLVSQAGIRLSWNFQFLQTVDAAIKSLEANGVRRQEFLRRDSILLAASGPFIGSRRMRLSIRWHSEMDFHDYDAEQHFRALWDSVAIARSVSTGLFTFGESDLPYFLVVDSKEPRDPVELSRGVVKVTRPVLITPENAAPEFRNFFDDDESYGMIDFLLARTAAFSNLKLENQFGKSELSSDSVEEVVARVSRQLDDEDEDRVAILTAPHRLGKLAVLKYTTQRIIDSAPDNLQDLRDRGFLP